MFKRTNLTPLHLNCPTSSLKILFLGAMMMISACAPSNQEPDACIDGPLAAVTASATKRFEWRARNTAIEEWEDVVRASAPGFSKYKRAISKNENTVEAPGWYMRTVTVTARPCGKP